MTAVPVTWATPGTPEWLEARRFGGSDIAAALGLTKWKSATRLWLEKTGQIIPSHAGEAAEWGHRLEPVLLARFMEDRPGVLDTAPDDMPSVVAHPDHPQLTVSLDGLWHHREASTVVEAKTVGLLAADDWADGGMPDSYLVQTLYQMAVTGLPTAHVPVLIGGQRYEERTVNARPDYQNDLIEWAVWWWDRHIVGGRQPDESNVLPPPTPIVEPDSTIVIGLDVLTEYADARAARDHAQHRLDQAEETLRDLFGEATHAITGDGRLVATYKPRAGRESVSPKAVRELLPPQLAGELITTGQPGRSLLWKGLGE
jgi:putative phage-type endonuclease